MNGGAPSASVVIPARDAEATIGACVRALRSQAPSVPVLVVDDGSRDATAARAEEAGAKVLRMAASGGPARARNAGVRATEGEVVVFTDADCEPLPGFVERLLAPFADPSVTGTKGAYVSEQRSLVARFVQLEYEERYARMAARREIDFIDTYACAYRRSRYLEVGGFDERYRFPSTEDQELSFRLHAKGARLVFVPDARTKHRHADTLGGYLAKKAKIGTFKVATLRAHPAKAVDDAHTPPGLKAQVVLAPFALAALAAIPWAPEPWGRAGACAPLALFLVTALPLALRALRRDPAVAPFVPALVLLRALALGAGLARGLAREAFGAGVLPRAEVA